MRYNTGNPVEPDGSSDPRDLFDNAGNIDLFANGSNPSYLDRKGVSRKSIRGMEQDFSDFLANSGFEPVHLVYVDGQPLTVSRPTQLIDRDGRTYRVKFPAAFPVTLTGTWATDLTKLVEIDDQALRQDLASAEGYDQIGATLPTGVVSTVKGFFNWILDRITLSTSGSASIVAAVAKGEKVVIKNGVHYMFAPAICDYGVEPIVGFAGHPSKRYDISGETPGGTILSNQHSDNALRLIGSYPVTQNFGGFDAVGNLTVVGPNVTTPNTDNTGGSGIFVQSKAYTKVYNYAAINLRIGLHFDGVLTSSVEDATISGCYEGLIFEDTNTTSGPNAINLRRVKVGECPFQGGRIELASSFQADNLTVEGCGTMGGIGVGLLWQSKAGSLGVNVNLNATYNELNAGPADTYIYHVSSQPMVFNINGGLYHRSTPNRYVETNLLVRREVGAGNVTVKVSGVTFLSSFGYVSSGSRPYWDVGPGCEVIWDESCIFSDLVAMNYWICLDRSYEFVVSAAGDILAGPEGFFCTKVSTGKYRFGRNAGKAEFAKFATDYTVTGTSEYPGSNLYLSYRQEQFFEVSIDNGSTLIDAPFSVIVKRVKGYYS
ncbi:hypothetical protein [Pseudomonas fluorescens]|uniref:hypothetical protein n=1 Tax=Pseudomonas fluorescens TaxID=294 RepID=UPI0004D0BB1D|nr:hypothetical protein [Pseudomonas fluorescens]AIG00937.1 hypothetical protein HZ99_01620 [Pseudomonas fluorescens]